MGGFALSALGILLLVMGLWIAGAVSIIVGVALVATRQRAVDPIPDCYIDTNEIKED